MKRYSQSYLYRRSSPPSRSIAAHFPLANAKAASRNLKLDNHHHQTFNLQFSLDCSLSTFGTHIPMD